MVVIVGYGRVGRTVAAICTRAQIPYAVIETDVDLVRLAQSEGAGAQYGDGADPRVMERGIGPATRVVLSTIPDTMANLALTKRLSHLTNLRIVVRAGGCATSGLFAMPALATLSYPRRKARLVSPKRYSPSSASAKYASKRWCESSAPQSGIRNRFGTSVSVPTPIVRRGKRNAHLWSIHAKGMQQDEGKRVLPPLLLPLRLSKIREDD